MQSKGKNKTITITKILLMFLIFAMIMSTGSNLIVSADTSTPVTISVTDGSSGNGRIKYNSSLTFTISTSTPGAKIKKFYYQWDRNIKGGNATPVIIPENEQASTIQRTVPLEFTEADCGIHELSVAAYDTALGITSWYDFSLYVQKEEPTGEPDTTAPTFRLVEPSYPRDGATIAQGQKLTIGVTDESGVYLFAYKWTKDQKCYDYSQYNQMYAPPSSFTIDDTPTESGTWYLQFYATDTYQNTAGPYSTKLIIADKEAPKVTLIGDQTMDVRQGANFVDPGATWVDNVDAPKTIKAKTPLDTSKVGLQVLRYSEPDSAGNPSNEVLRYVTVVGDKDTYRLTLPEKTIYEFGEEIDLTGASITKISSRGEETPNAVQVTADMFEWFDTSDQDAIGEQQEAIFSYGGAELIYPYTVIDKITNVTISKQPTKTTYEYGYEGNLDLTGGELTVTYKTGKVETVDLTEAMVKTFSGTSTTGNKTVGLAYGDYTGSISLRIKVVKRNVEVTIDNKSSKYGEGLQDLTWRITNGSIANRDAGTENPLGINVSKAAGTNVGPYAITGTYNNNNYAVTFVPGTYTIEQADAKDVSGIQYNNHFTYDGTSKTVSVKSGTEVEGVNVTFTGDNKTEANTYPITVTFESTDPNYKNPEPTTIDMVIEKATPSISNVVINATYGDTLGKQEIKAQLPAGWSFVQADTTSVGDATETGREFDVKYNADNNHNSATGKVTIKVAKANGSFVMPEGITAYYGDTLGDIQNQLNTKYGNKYSIVYANGQNASTPIKTLSPVTLTLAYTADNNHTTVNGNLTITAIDYITSIDLESGATITGTYGITLENLTVTGNLIVNYAGQGAQTVALSNATISAKEGTEYNPSTLAEQKLTITYGIDRNSNPVTKDITIKLTEISHNVEIVKTTINGTTAELKVKCTNTGCDYNTEQTVTATEVTSTTTATCTESGEKTYTIKYIFPGETTERTTIAREPQAALGHDMKHNNAKPATCTEAGTVEYWACARCNKNFSDEEGNTVLTSIVAPAKGHTPSAAVDENVVNATCEADGSHDEVVYCSVCNAEISREAKTDTKLGHNYDYDNGTWKIEKVEGAYVATYTSTCKNDSKHTDAKVATVSEKEHVNSTCTQKGHITYTATVTINNKDYTLPEAQEPTEDLDLLNHTPSAAVDENVVNATCEADGSHDEVVYCSVCNAEISREAKTDAKLGHNYDYDNGTWTIEKVEGAYVATYTSTCKNDSKHTDAKVATVSEKEHVKATCVDDGHIIYTATVTINNKDYTLPENQEVTETLEALEPEERRHINWNILEYTNATCTEDGTVVKICAKQNCGVTVTETLPAAHQWKNATPENVTLNNDGTATITLICDINNEHTQQIDISAEKIKVTSIEPTCTTAGYTTYEITYTKPGAIGIAKVTKKVDGEPALGHTPVTDPAVAPTCTETGLTEGSHCSVCNEVLVAQQEVKATGHTYDYENKGAWVWSTDHQTAEYITVCENCKTEKDIRTATVNSVPTAATCTEDGYTVYTATVTIDNKEYTDSQKVVDTGTALGHDKVDHEAKAPTCTEIGWDAYETCSRCDYTTYEEKAALGHNKVDHEAKAPTCTEIGWDAYETCSRCDYTTYEEKVALGHTYVATDDSWTWSTDYSSVTLHLVCSKDNKHTVDIQNEDITISHERTKNPTGYVEGEDVHKASTTYNGTNYSVEKVVAVPTLKTEFPELAEQNTTFSNLNASNFVMPTVDKNNEELQGTLTLNDTDRKLTAGQHELNVTYTPNDANLKPADGKIIINVSKAVIDVDKVEYIKEFTYNTEKQYVQVDGELPAGLKVGFTGNGRVAVGTYDVTATFTLTDANNYKFKDTETATTTRVVEMKINKAVIDIDEVEFENEYEYKEETKRYVQVKGELPAGLSVTFTGNGRIAAETYDVTAIYKVTNKNYYEIKDGNNTGLEETTRTVQLKINPQEKDVSGIKFENTTTTYNGEKQYVSVDATTVPEYIYVGISGNGRIDARDYEVKITYTSTNQNYKPSKEEDTITLTILPAELNADDLTVEMAEEFVKDGNAKEPTITVSNKLIKDKDYTESVIYTNKDDGTTSTEAPTEIGNYTVTVTITGEKNYTGDISVEKDFSIKGQYTVTFNSNGGTAIEQQNVIDGGKATRPTNPTKNNEESIYYAFENWYTDESLTTPYSFDTAVTSNITLYAKYHNLTKTAAKEAKCEETGNNEYYTCSGCAKVFKDADATQVTTVEDETLRALGHTEKTREENRVDSTCKVNGSYDEVTYCEVCKAVLRTDNKELPLAAHTPGEKQNENIQPASCSETGSVDEVVYCTICGTEISRETVTIPKKAHTVVEDTRVEPICTTAGKTAGSHCSVCGEVLQPQTTIAATGHDYEITSWNWIEGTPGEYTTYESVTVTLTCNNDNTHTTTEDATLTYEVTAPTGYAKGKIEYTATYKGETDTKEVEIPTVSTTFPDLVEINMAYNGTKASELAMPTKDRNGANIDGTITFTGTDKDLTVGPHTINVTFTPSNTDLRPVDGTLTVNVTKGTPTYTVPTNVTAVYGQTLSEIALPTGFTFEANGTTKVGNAGNNTFKVTYTPTDTTNYDVVTGINMTVTVEKAVYTLPNTVKFENGAFDLDGNGHSIFVTGLPEGITATYAGNNQCTVGQHDVTATFVLSQALQANYKSITPATMSAKLTIRTVDRISITKAPTAVNYGDELNFNGATIKVIMTDNTERTVNITAGMIENYNPRSTATQTVTVRYAEKTATFNVTLKDEIQYIYAVNNSNVTTYNLGDNIPTQNIVVKAVKKSGEYDVTSEARINGVTIGTPIQANRDGTFNLVATYGEFTADPITVTVIGIDINYQVMSESGVLTDGMTFTADVTLSWNTAATVKVDGNVINGNSTTVTSIGDHTIQIGDNAAKTFHIEQPPTPVVVYDIDETNHTVAVNDWNQIESAHITITKTTSKNKVSTVLDQDLSTYLSANNPRQIVNTETVKVKVVITIKLNGQDEADVRIFEIPANS